MLMVKMTAQPERLFQLEPHLNVLLHITSTGDVSVALFSDIIGYLTKQHKLSG